MPNEEHLKVLRQGVKAWRDWTLHTLLGKPDLSQADLHEARLNCANLGGADLSGANLNGADLFGANLVAADLSAANLGHAKLDHADLREARLTSANLVRASLSGARLSPANLNNADLSNAYLSGTNLKHSNFSHAKLIGTQLIQADLRSANLTAANFAGARLDDADLRNADLRGANFAGAFLAGADFSGALFGDANLSQAAVGKTIFSNNDLSTVEGLQTVNHLGPSTIGIDTLFRSTGNLPEVFLRGAGLSEDFITFVPSLVGQAIEFYSCFISYSHKDEEFSRHLCSRMRKENLRVWYAPEDMKAGRKLYEEIFNAIQIHDKLLLVLSESSMKSGWVTTEILRAKKVEREENRRKLFPIRLVDFDVIQKWECFDTDSKKDLAVEVREYYIPDFSNWKHYDAFELEFAKLLRDLRASESKIEAQIY